MVNWVLDACRQGGCDQQVVVVGHQREQVAETVAADDDGLCHSGPTIGHWPCGAGY